MNGSCCNSSVMILLLLGTRGVFAQSDQEVKGVPPTHPIVFRAGWAPARDPNYPGCETYLTGGARKGKDDVMEARGAQAWMIPRADLWVIVNYPPLRVGQIVPVFGQLCRVAEIHDRGEPKGYGGSDSMVVTKADEKSLPAGLRLHEKSVVIPLNRERVGNATFDRGDTSLLLLKIEPGEPNDKRGPTAEIRLFDSRRNPPDTLFRVGRGDTLAIRKAQYKVLNVVPRDEKTHVIGWVELAP